MTILNIQLLFSVSHLKPPVSCFSPYYLSVSNIYIFNIITSMYVYYNSNIVYTIRCSVFYFVVFYSYLYEHFKCKQYAKYFSRKDNSTKHVKTNVFFSFHTMYVLHDITRKDFLRWLTKNNHGNIVHLREQLNKPANLWYNNSKEELLNLMIMLIFVRMQARFYSFIIF